MLGDPPARRAREAGEHPGPGRRARPGRGRGRRRPAGAARPRVRGGPGARRPPARPGPGGAGPLAGRWSSRPTWCSRSSRTAAPTTSPGRPDARAGRRGAAHRGAHQRGALRRPLRRPDRRRARRVPPAGRRWTPATSTGSTPRATSSPARRWRRSPRRSPPPRGWTSRAARRLLAATRRVADRCAVDPRADLGMGEVHFPDLDVRRTSGGATTDDPVAAAQAMLRQRCEGGLGRRAMAATPEVRRRLDDELGVIESLGYPSYFLTVGRRRRPDPRHGGAGRGPRLGRRQPGQLPAGHLRGRPDPARPADGAVPLAAARGAARRGHRRRVGPAYRGLRADPGPVRRRAGRLRLDDGHLPGAARDPRRGGRPGHAAGRDRPDRQGVPAHPGPRRARRRCASCPSCGRPGSRDRGRL